MFSLINKLTEELKKESIKLPNISLSERQLCDLELILNEAAKEAAPEQPEGEANGAAEAPAPEAPASE
jgi:hypothetical protein